MELVMPELFGRFGHHPNPADDFCIEVEVIEGMASDISIGFEGSDPYELNRRIERAMEFRVGGDEIAVQAKQRLRKIEGAQIAGRVKTVDQTGIAELIYSAMPITRLQTVKTVGPSGTGMAGSVQVMMPVAWNDLSSEERRLFLKAASNVMAAKQ